MGDYAVMMDSLEYMEDDAGYIRDMVRKIKRAAISFLHYQLFQFCFQTTISI